MSRRRALLALAILCSGCATPPTEGNEGASGLDPATFAPVANALVVRCGTIDCHGSTYRNMRLYGYAGLRLDPTSRPDTPKTATPAEVTKDYEAVVSVEPGLTRAVVADRGAGAERLTLVRKARGTEDHKGGAPIVPGDDADRCLLSWFAAAVDGDACQRVVDHP